MFYRGNGLFLFSFHTLRRFLDWNNRLYFSLSQHNVSKIEIDFKYVTKPPRLLVWAVSPFSYYLEHFYVNVDS